MIRVLIVDDHPIVRKGLRSELSSQSDMQVVADAANGDEALALARELKPDIIVLDLSLPGKGGLEILRQLRDEASKPKVLMLSVYPEKQYAVRCLKSGAWGYITKSSASEELVAAIRKVAEGKKYVSEQLGEILASEIDAKKLSAHERLSAREFEILRLIGRGKSISEIAELLSLSVSTVSTHRLHLLSKMQLETTAQLIRYAIEHDLIDHVD
ncbi:MAG: response regulator transcription factor [Ignavibacteriae bacterium]|nr:response regulator transcription factor [Ignavibacteriota bacterium]